MKEVPVLQLESVGDAVGLAQEHRDRLRAAVTEHGALLVRGLGLSDTTTCGAVFRRLGHLEREREAYAPRNLYTEGVYSATRWPGHQAMCLHHEASYRLEFPSLMMFACLAASPEGGATLLADSTSVLSSLPRELVERFERFGWMLLRSYHDEVGGSVAAAFGSDDRRAVESYARANAIELEWGPESSLRTRQVRSAVMAHPVTGLRCWFNQIAFLNAWTMEPEVREYLIDLYGEDGLPFDTRYGDGERISADVVRAINDAYQTHTVVERWQSGDLLLLDNIRTAHGREPFKGRRDLVVAMADAVKRT